MSVYYFDEEIKNLIFKNILEVVKSFKSVLSYVFSEYHRDLYSYLNILKFDGYSKYDCNFSKNNSF